VIDEQGMDAVKNAIDPSRLGLEFIA